MESEKREKQKLKRERRVREKNTEIGTHTIKILRKKTDLVNG